MAGGKFDDVGVSGILTGWSDEEDRWKVQLVAADGTIGPYRSVAEPTIVGCVAANNRGLARRCADMAELRGRTLGVALDLALGHHDLRLSSVAPELRCRQHDGTQALVWCPPDRRHGYKAPAKALHR